MYVTPFPKCIERLATRNQEDKVSGEHHRVVFGTGADTRYKFCNSEKEARGAAADKIHRGYVSQVAVEECKKGQWVPTQTHSYRG